MTQTNQPVTGFVETNGTKLYYEEMGEGHPLVLIHGGYMDRRMWDDQFAAFAQHYRVVRYDVRGFGKTGLPQVPYTDRQDLFHLLSFLGVDKPLWWHCLWGVRLPSILRSTIPIWLRLWCLWELLSVGCR